jgi:hypothetical protein
VSLASAFAIWGLICAHVWIGKHEIKKLKKEGSYLPRVELIRSTMVWLSLVGPCTLQSKACLLCIKQRLKRFNSS